MAPKKKKDEDEVETIVIEDPITIEAGDNCATVAIGDTEVVLSQAQLDVFSRQVSSVQHALY